MRTAHKQKLPEPGPFDLKAAIIRRHGTIAAYIRSTGKKAGTVYATIGGRRNGPKSIAIRTEVLG